MEQLWGDYSGVQYRSEEKFKEKFYNIKDGVHLSNDLFFNLESLIKNSITNWINLWGLPMQKKLPRNDYTQIKRIYKKKQAFKNNISLKILHRLMKYLNKF